MPSAPESWRFAYELTPTCLAWPGWHASTGPRCGCGAAPAFAAKSRASSRVHGPVTRPWKAQSDPRRCSARASFAAPPSRRHHPGTYARTHLPLTLGRRACRRREPLVALLEATGRSLRDDEPYPRLFGQITRGISHGTIQLPVMPAGTEPVVVQFYENLAISANGEVRLEPKPREDPFESFADYRDRLVKHMASAFANARQYEPLATISSGYDSTASASVGARAAADKRRRSPAAGRGAAITARTTAASAPRARWA